ncbi:MAG: serine protease, partial [Reyranella sp.]|nr:serine protease [Reyranella sp.]
MTKTKTILAALAVTTALTAPALIAPMFTAPAAVAGQVASGVQDFSDLAAKVTPAVVNVAVTMKVGAGDDEDVRASGPQDKQMEEFMKRFAERFGQPMQPGAPDGKRSQRKGHGVGTGFIVDAKGTIVTNFHVVNKADSITVT